MTNIINLNRFRKKKKRDEAAQTAEENRVRFGRTKAQKNKDTLEKEQAASHLDGHKSDQADCDDA